MHLGFGRFFGHVAAARATERVHLSRAAYPPREQVPSHGHTSVYLSFVVTGSYVESVGSRQFACVPSTLRFHPAGEEHADQFGRDGALCLNIELAGDWEDALDHAGLAHRGPIAIDTAAWPALRLSAGVDSDIVPSPLAVEELALELLDACSGAEQRLFATAGSRPLARAIEYIDAHAATALTLGHVAAAAEVHPTHLARLFRQRLDCTVSAYVRSRRLIGAQRDLLARPDWSVSRIAIEHGFADHAHLSRTFRRAFDVTPSRFRDIAAHLDER